MLGRLLEPLRIFEKLAKAGWPGFKGIDTANRMLLKILYEQFVNDPSLRRLNRGKASAMPPIPPLLTYTMRVKKSIHYIVMNMFR